jgi:putative endonuclease
MPGYEEISVTSHLNLSFMKSGHNYYVYILECSDDSYYTGVTNDLERRLWEHQEGYNKSCYTYNRRPVELRYAEHYHQIHNAIAREKQIKGWCRKKKEALFREDWDELKRLSKSRLRQAQPDSEIK